jgi:hypothetical protein
MNEENYINQEVRIRLLEELIKENKDNFKHLDQKMNSQFLIILGIFLTALVTKLFV